MEFKVYKRSRPPGALAEMINSDRFFQRNPSAAYAQAWAFTFYLVETQPRRYAEYLKRTAAVKPGEPYPPAARAADFTKVFGDNWAMHEARFKRFMAEVK